MISPSRKQINRMVPALLLVTHWTLTILFGYRGWLDPFELFNVILLIANIILFILSFFGRIDLFMGTAFMIIVASHALIGQKMAPDSLTSGSILMINILVVFTGFKIHENLTRKHFFIFAISYFILFIIFVITMSNAEALFLLSLMGLCATARSFRLLSYFWAMVLSFTLFQPYPWLTLCVLFFILHIAHSQKNNSRMIILFLVVGATLTLFVLFPVLSLIFEEDPRNIVNILSEKGVIDALIITAVSATLSTVILFLFCVPFAYALSRSKFTGKSALLSFIDIPIIIPQSAAGIAILKIFGKQQLVGGAVFDMFGVQFDGTILGIMIAQIFVAMPFLLKSAMSAFEAVPVLYEHEARTLGASSLGSFFRVSMPLASRGIIAGVILAWARAAGEFGAVLFIAPNPQSAPIAVYNRFTSMGLSQTAPLVTTLLLFSIVLFFILQLLGRLTPSAHGEEVSR
jgi:molybdate/tungstate transport system permease protein